MKINVKIEYEDELKVNCKEVKFSVITTPNKYMAFTENADTLLSINLHRCTPDEIEFVRNTILRKVAQKVREFLIEAKI